MMLTRLGSSQSLDWLKIQVVLAVAGVCEWIACQGSPTIIGLHQIIITTYDIYGNTFNNRGSASVGEHPHFIFQKARHKR